ncbi:hypothetical protein PSAC2689_60113 [Paraburkholderia sacchari]
MVAAIIVYCNDIIVVIALPIWAAAPIVCLHVKEKLSEDCDSRRRRIRLRDRRHPHGGRPRNLAAGPFARPCRHDASRRSAGRRR